MPRTAGVILYNLKILCDWVSTNGCLVPLKRRLPICNGGAFNFPKGHFKMNKLLAALIATAFAAGAAVAADAPKKDEKKADKPAAAASAASGAAAKKK